MLNIDLTVPCADSSTALGFQPCAVLFISELPYILIFMRADGYQTRGKIQILSFLESKKDTAVSVQDIASYLREHGEDTCITTIYRRLEKLINERKVIRHTAEDGKKSLFQYIADDTGCLHHLHVQCTSCLKIIHLDCNDSEEFIRHLSSKHGIVLDCKKTVLYGLCENCGKKL
ncbi:transcriptional repressor [Treponema parvum]|uniref:Transcriptional repressor n=1 Tax=Treponema parvum TaxID=138851 RepID=A0A975F0E5_9SPIR|nr:transcriptional repressor [Treponema parvum]QTQ12048.1 transcriptional repressor [Treponema parvum]